jgi:hypothetical protein
MKKRREKKDKLKASPNVWNTLPHNNTSTLNVVILLAGSGKEAFIWP